MQNIAKRIKLPEMAELLSRSSKQFRKDIRNHKIPFILLGRTKLFDPVEVFEFLKKQSRLSQEQVLSDNFLRKGKIGKKKSAANFANKARYKKLLDIN